MRAAINGVNGLPITGLARIRLRDRGVRFSKSAEDRRTFVSSHRMILRPVVRRVAEGIDQKRHVVMRLACGNLEEDDDRRVERTNPAQLEIRSGIEDESVRSGRERRVVRHQGSQTFVRIGLFMTQELSLIGATAALEHDVHARGRTPERRIENVSRDRAQAEQLYSLEI